MTNGSLVEGREQGKREREGEEETDKGYIHKEYRI
jgi:hypothetical protein